MTTRITIVHHAHQQPDKVVKVQTVMKDGRSYATSDIVAPGESKEFYVHDGQYLIVSEELKTS